MRDAIFLDSLVAPFCHSPMRLRLPHRSLFRRQLARADFETLLGGTAPAVRQNVGRIFVAALVAERLGAPLAFVEGWRCHVIERPRGRPVRLLTGARVSALFLRMLQRRRLVSQDIRPVRREVSRCTLDEVQALVALNADRHQPSRPRLDPEARPRPRIVGIAGRACPSAVRARRYLQARAVHPSEVWAPARALARFGLGLDPAQSGLLRATDLGWLERLWYLIFEGINWGMHATSELERLVLGASRPLEQRLAHRLRADREP
jgi:hypothetical protein